VGILVTAAFVIGVYYFYEYWNDFQYRQAEMAYLEKEMRNYQRLEAMYEEQARRLDELNRIWNRVEKSGLDRDLWRMYDLSVNRVLEWQQLESLMLIASNDITGDQIYWFRPQMFRVSRAVEETRQAPGQEGAIQGVDVGGGLVQQGYETLMTGRFIIRKAD
jgi:hypothetical protein